VSNLHPDSHSSTLDSKNTRRRILRDPAKKQAYRRNGVKEYLVWQVLDRKLSWFYLKEGEYLELSADNDGIIRSKISPGLWLAVSELLGGNMPQVLTVLQAGWQSPEHSAFVQKLANE